MDRIEYFDVYAGGGKTHSAVIQADYLARAGFKVAIIQPTKHLLDETLKNEIEKLDPAYSVTMIHGDNVDQESVIKKIVGHFRDARQDEGEIVGMTHAAFLQVPYLHHRENWIVIVDEVLSVSPAGTINMPDTHHLVTQHLVSTPVDAKYSLVEPTQDGRAVLLKVAKNKHEDGVYEVVKEMTSYIADENYKVYVISSQYERMLLGRDKVHAQLSWFAVLQPTFLSGFKRVVVMSALMEYQLMYSLWLRIGVNWTPVPDSWREELRYTQHLNGGSMTCYYAGNADWSKLGRDEVQDNGFTRWDHVTKAILDQVGDRPCLWMANKDTDFNALVGSRTNIVQLPNTPHGLNTYQDYNCVVVTSALNATPAHVAFLASRGISQDELRTANYRSAAYQAWMRSSARNPLAHANKMLVVMDRSTAEFMCEVFPGMKCGPVPGLGMGKERSAGRPRIHANEAARKKAYADSVKQGLLAELLSINADDVLPLVSSGSSEKQGQIPFYKSKDVPTNRFRLGLDMQFFEDLHVSLPFTNEAIDDFEDIISFLRQMSNSWVANSKDEQVLSSPSYFLANAATDTDRGIDNIQYMYGIWIDTDGGDLAPDEFAALFPYVRMCAYETYNSTTDDMRWRAFMPTSHVLTPHVHECLLKQIVQVVNEAGYWSKGQLAKNSKIKKRKCHGFDSSKYNGASLFYLPSTRSGRKTYFKDFVSSIRAPIDVPRWIEYSIENLSPEPIIIPAPDPLLEGRSPEMVKLIEAMRRAPGTFGGVNELAVEMATSEWRGTRAGEGNKAFFKFACRLQDSHMPLDEIERTLRQECRSSGSDGNDRKAQIKSIVRQLDRRGTFRPTHGNSLPDWL